MQDYSHILHTYFVGVFRWSHPYRNVILIIRYKVSSLTISCYTP